jgi:ribosomal protein S18 acetylase RimI-like enzyme
MARKVQTKCSGITALSSLVDISRHGVSLEEFIETVKKYDTYFTPRLSHLKDIGDWCRKIYENGTVDYYTAGDGKFAGLTAYYANDLTGGEGYLTLIFLDIEFQNKGLAQILFNDVVANCKKAGMRFLKLECSKVNIGGVKFYKKMKGKISDENEQSFFFSFDLN